MRVEEERKLRGEIVDAQASVERGLDVGDAVGEGKGDFLDGGRASFADVVALNGDGVPLWNAVVPPTEDIGHDAHRGPHRINVRSAGDVFLKNVVLHRAGKFFEAGALFFRDRDI